MHRVQGRHNVVSVGRETAQINDLQLTDIWKFLLRRRALILAGAVLGGIVGYALYLRAPRLYTSTATVEMNRDATSGLGLQDLSGAGSALGIGQDFMTDMLTQQAVLTNDNTALSVLQSTTLISNTPLMSKAPFSDLPRQIAAKNHLQKVPKDTDPEVRDAALGLFRKSLRVVPVKNTRLMTVSYTDRDPNEAAAIANAVVEAYLTNHTSTRFDATNKASDWLEKQLKTLEDKGINDQNRVADLEKQIGLFSVSGPSAIRGSDTSAEGATANPDLAQLLALNQALSQAELARIQQGTVFQLSQTADPKDLLDPSAAQLVTREGTVLAANSQHLQFIQSLRNQKASLQVRLDGEKVTYAAMSPIVLELKSQIDSAQKQIDAEMSEIQKQAKRDYDLAKANEAAIRLEVAKKRAKVDAVGDKVVQLAFDQEQAFTDKRLYQDLLTRLEEAKIAAGVRSSGMAIVDPARALSQISSPRLKDNIGAGVAGGLLLALLAALTLQLRDTTLNIPDDFEENSPYPMLGVVPGFEGSGDAVYGGTTAPPGKVDDQAWILRAPKSQLAEAYRQIRTSILLSRADNPPKVLLFTSPLGGDGKSTTAYNLAAAFAAQSAKVLILDADMRRSTIGKLAGCTGKTGLSDILSTNKSFDELVQTNPNLPSLRVLVAGTVPPDPSELLGSKRFASLIEELKGKFDYVLIDAPPALLVTDPVVASTVSDAVVVVLRAGKTHKPALRRFWAVLDNPSTNVLGFVVNDFNRRLQSYGYGYEGYGTTSYKYYSGGEKA